VGSTGTAQEDFEESGPVMVMGELWQAVSRKGKITKGQKIKVTGRKDFTLFIEPADA